MRPVNNNWVIGHKCEVCKDADAVMALTGRNKAILCRLCRACHTITKLKTEFEAWRGDMLEQADTHELGEATDEYMIQMDRGNLS
jgi:hypothetical protein